MKNCRICESALAQPDYRADAPAMTSLSTMIDIGTEVFVCRTCGHVQSPDLPDVQGFYDHDYRISLQSDGHDQLYEMSADGPVFRTTQQARLLEDLDIPIGAKLLDFGAAKAVTTRRFLDRRPDIRPHVFDVSEDYRSFWDEWVPSDAQATYTLPKDWLGHFDLITSHFVLEHVADPVSILASLKACLAPDGRLFFTVPDPIENSGDFLVVDHLNHFVPTSLHCALQAAGLSVVSARQDLFRGAHVVVAEHRAQDEIADVPDQTADVLALLNDWRHMLDNLRFAITTPETADAKIAVYGAGFYGNLFSSLAKARIVCFLDRNPHLLGGTVDGKPILSPEDCPSVDLVIAALNPARARDILPPDANWIPKNAQVIYPEARTVTISLVIPTRSRAVYLRETLKTVAIALQACTQQVEVIVSDNASDDETEDVCAQSDIPELTYVRQPNRLSMRQSFEAGLRASTGSHVVFMGDDDAVAPHGLVLLHEMIASGDHDIFKWRIVNYIWPDPDRGRKGGVVLRNNKLSGRVRRIDPKALLADFKTARIGGYQTGAMIYHGCISRKLIDKVRAAQNGTYFWTTCPDVYASVVNLIHADTEILAVDIPITIGGSSPRSNGTAGTEYVQNLTTSSSSEYAKFVTEFKGDPCLGLTTATCPSVNLVTIDALQLSHKFAGIPLKLAEAAWLGRIEPEIKSFPASIAADARHQASMLLPSVSDRIEQIPARSDSPTAPFLRTPPTFAKTKANVRVSLAKIKIDCGPDMNDLTQASTVIDQICGASTSFSLLPTTVFGSVLQVFKMLGRARAYKNRAS